MRETVLEAVLRSADAPSEVQRNRFAAFLKKQYGQEVPLRWEQDPALEKGFRMEVGADLYDWSLEGRLRQFQFFTQGLAHFPIRQRKLFDGFQSRIQSSSLICFYFESFNIEVL